MADASESEIERAASFAFDRLAEGALAVLVKLSRLPLAHEERLVVARRVVDAFAGVCGKGSGCRWRPSSTDRSAPICPPARPAR